MKIEELVEERERILSRLVDYFKSLNGVKGIFVAGSIPSGKADKWSDIDARVIVSPDRYEEVLSERLMHPKEWGSLAFNEWEEGVPCCVSHFRPFNKVDVFYYSSDHMAPSPWYTLPIDVYLDPDKIIEKLIEDSVGMVFVPPQGEVDRLIGKSIATAHEIYRRSQRGELLYAQEMLSDFRRMLVESEAFLAKRSFENIERSAPEYLKISLEESYVKLNRSEVLKVLRSLAILHKEQVRKLHGIYELSRSLNSDIESIDIILVFDQ